ncbi:3-keto steroid reductase [Geosmithia morbida]|uniref:3-keto steroid reductase n=1 Tax=Geosmithia morbida TaxID=1094350 RepID=A0A9P4YVJ0_9HYPO|nr:3-keto steroid reductase [Geosmithia morbida]KAF4122815.1 3-keto steroid reductase [Geosmithia morbida]
MSEKQSAPWEVAHPKDHLFVLITGANGGIGLAACERLIDEFLATRPLTSHLILLPTTRSATKSRQAIRHLRLYAERVAQTCSKLRSRYLSTPPPDVASSSSSSPVLSPPPDIASPGPDAEWDWRPHAARIHVISPQVDLCDLRAVYALAGRMCTGTIGNPPGTEGPDGRLERVVIPRIDSAIFNAAYGGWSGFSLPGALWSFVSRGFVTSVTWPDFKLAMPTSILNEQAEYNYPPKPLLGQVFTACVLGHHVLARQLLPLLSRPADSALDPGRIIWTSSLEAHDGDLIPSDMQAFNPTTPPYESAKRLTDILILSHTLPSVKPLADAYLTSPSTINSSSIYRDDDNSSNNNNKNSKNQKAPRIYLSHPGIVASSLFPVPWFLFWAYQLALVVARWLGSPWHVGNAYRGASSVVWLTLRDQEALDSLDAQRSKWGSATDPSGRSFVKRTEVDGWGWTGSLADNQGVAAGTADDASVEGLRDAKGKVLPNLSWGVGRKRSAMPVTQEGLSSFEELGRECWVKMEDMREELEDILGL